MRAGRVRPALVASTFSHQQLLRIMPESARFSRGAETDEYVWKAVLSEFLVGGACQVALLLKEYLDSSDVAEATECLRALKMPFFHHELVKKALVHAIEEPASAQVPYQCHAFVNIYITHVSVQMLRMYLR